MMNPVDRLKRGQLVAALINYQQPGMDLKFKCMLCGEVRPIAALELHHMVSRFQVSDKQVLKLYYPVELFALLCYRCNHNDYKVRADSVEGRSILLQYSINLWGKDKVRAAIVSFNDRLINPIAPNVLNYSLLDEKDGD